MAGSKSFIAFIGGIAAGVAIGYLAFTEKGNAVLDRIAATAEGAACGSGKDEPESKDQKGDGHDVEE